MATLKTAQYRAHFAQAYWQEIIKTHPGYRDGYFALAQSEYQLGKGLQAKVHVTQALALDPNFSAGALFAGNLALAH